MKGTNAIASRQRTDPLFESTDLLATGATFSSVRRDTRGYGSLTILAFSDLSFRIRIEEALSSDGPWTEVARITSALNEAGTDQGVYRRIVPIGSFMRVFVDNLGVTDMTRFQFSVRGLPVGDPANAAGGDITADVTVTDVTPGATITTPANTAVGIGATVGLPAIPANTRRIRVQATGGDSTTTVLVREVGAGAGRGILLTNNGSTTYGGADGAIEALEAENSAGPAVTVRVQFEGD